MLFIMCANVEGGRITEIQRRAAAPIVGGQDVLVQSQTGSGKTLSFVMPLLARLQYPPAVYPEDLKVCLETLLSTWGCYWPLGATHQITVAC